MKKVDKVAAALHALAEALTAEEAPPAPEDPWIQVHARTLLAGYQIRGSVLLDAERRGEITIGRAGRTRVVQRSEIERWLASRGALRRRPRKVAAPPAPTHDPVIDLADRFLARATRSTRAGGAA